MSTISRTLSNLYKVGIKDYFKQMLYIGDTKYGRLVGTDRAGNKFFENNEELPLRTRWVEYAKHDYDAAHIEPGWHAWISYSLDTPPTEDALIKAGTRHFEPTKAIPNYTQTRGAFKTYNTTKPKIQAWQPVATPRA
ncbi:NADH ubiquinone oxidoreductase subunit NDUFA12-domain-containing protein [Ilyonectria robusta]|uniref:NADH ubiquinone oxidoreductase subunit NDUFA12-domain-containing protein n=1 Tax=Ilyonectria robusta TaxID=1079257 RepID=UPI001E8EC3F1|nr:NADH ubiquinone oxidoreductase subunit NDUFA12-domain-containing protein [Ilyonectria robusta]KAH8734021.1 NADH ubiquinone oxidoreductase subunit NDUFA12-domain-containing protein [Ilyonectria robusta]